MGPRYYSPGPGTRLGGILDRLLPRRSALHSWSVHVFQHTDAGLAAGSPSSLGGRMKRGPKAAFAEGVRGKGQACETPP